MIEITVHFHEELRIEVAEFINLRTVFVLFYTKTMRNDTCPSLLIFAIASFNSDIQQLSFPSFPDFRQTHYLYSTMHFTTIVMYVLL